MIRQKSQRLGKSWSAFRSAGIADLCDLMAAVESEKLFARAGLDIFALPWEANLPMKSGAQKFVRKSRGFSAAISTLEPTS